MSFREVVAGASDGGRHAPVMPVPSCAITYRAHVEPDARQNAEGSWVLESSAVNWGQRNTPTSARCGRLSRPQGSPSGRPGH